MEKEMNEVLEEGMDVRIENINDRPSKVKATILGIAAVTTGLLIAFRKKISAKIMNVMSKKLTKKGYTVLNPGDSNNNISEDFFDDLDESK